MIEIRVYDDPAPQGSKRHVGNGVMIESSRKVKPWREAVKQAALSARALDFPMSPLPLDEPLNVEMVFSFRRPRSHYRTGRNAHLLRHTAPVRPQGYPDLSKLARSTEDALTAAGIWRDDSRVVEYSRLAKVWVGEDPDALTDPGAVIRIRRAAGLSTVEGA